MNSRSPIDKPTPKGATPAPFRIPELLDRCMGDAAIAILLLDKFEKQLHTDILEIERQVAAGSAGEIARTAHSLKGAAGALASQPLRDCAARLEALARDNHLDSIARELSSLRAEVDRYLAYLPTTREELKHTTPGTSAGTEAGQ